MAAPRYREGWSGPSARAAGVPRHSLRIIGMISTKNAAAMSAIAAFCCGVAVEAAMATVSPSWAEMTKSRRALIEDVLAQERAFAKDTVRRGMREAFLTYIAAVSYTHLRAHETPE